MICLVNLCTQNAIACTVHEARAFATTGLVVIFDTFSRILARYISFNLLRSFGKPFRLFCCKTVHEIKRLARGEKMFLQLYS